MHKDLLQNVLGLQNVVEMLHRQTGRLLKTSNLNSTANSTEKSSEVKLKRGDSTNKQTDANGVLLLDKMVTAKNNPRKRKTAQHE